MTETRTAAQHTRWLSECTTAHLLDGYRSWPTAETRIELESRGVVLWHYGL